MKEFEESGAGRSPSVEKVGTILAVVVVAAVVVFSLGVMVGKRVTGIMPALSEPPSTLPTEGLKPLAQRPEEKPVKSPAKPQPKTAESAGEPLSSEKLTFFETLSSDKATVPPPLPAPPPKVKTAVARKPEPPPKKAETAEEPPPKPRQKTAAQNPGAEVMSLRGPGQYYVQVASTTKQAWAGDLVRRLKKRGVEARSTTVTLKGKRWYRIRVGTFPDRDAARQAMKVLKGMGQDGMVVRGD